MKQRPWKTSAVTTPSSVIPPSYVPPFPSTPQSSEKRQKWVIQRGKRLGGKRWVKQGKSPKKKNVIDLSGCSRLQLDLQERVGDGMHRDTAWALTRPRDLAGNVLRKTHQYVSWTWVKHTCSNTLFAAFELAWIFIEVPSLLKGSRYPIWSAQRTTKQR